jgi:hypothetical protein
VPLGERDASGAWTYNPNERYSLEELDVALRLRDSVTPDASSKRRDRCPHTPACANVRDCIENIAWFVRYRREILSAIGDV